MRACSWLLPFLALPTLAVPALAQNAPRLEPTRDVAVTYRTTGNKPETVQAAWLASARTLRLDLPRQGGWGLLNRRTGQARMVMEGMRLVTELPAEKLAEMGIPSAPGPNARFLREGPGRIAGLPCTYWRYTEGSAQGRACLTADGVLLSGEGTAKGKSGGIEATAVAYAPQDPSRFQVPPGYQTLNLPQGLPPGLLNAIPGFGR